MNRGEGHRARSILERIKGVRELKEARVSWRHRDRKEKDTRKEGKKGGT